MAKAPPAAGTMPGSDTTPAAGTMPGDAGGAEPGEVKLPARIRITHLHGFIDEDGTHRQWTGGTIVSRTDEVALLVDRKARFEVLEE